MSSLKRAFKEMRRQGLIAVREYYCPCCRDQMILDLADQWRNRQRLVRGWVYLDAAVAPPEGEEFRVSLVFGRIVNGKVLQDDQQCLAVGKMIAECLDDERIRYEWQRAPGKPIVVRANRELTGLLMPDQVLMIDTEEQPQWARLLPDSLFDQTGDNPIRLLNVAQTNQLVSPDEGGAPEEEEELLQVGDFVKLVFLVPGSLAPHARQQFGKLADHIQTESVLVEVTKIVGCGRNCSYRAEVVQQPVTLDPARVRLGSPICFTADQVAAVQVNSEEGAAG